MLLPDYCKNDTLFADAEFRFRFLILLNESVFGYALSWKCFLLGFPQGWQVWLDIFISVTLPSKYNNKSTSGFVPVNEMSHW